MHQGVLRCHHSASVREFRLQCASGSTKVSLTDASGYNVHQGVLRCHHSASVREFRLQCASGSTKVSSLSISERVQVTMCIREY